MVRVHVKRGEESCFLYDTPASTPVGQLVQELASLQNLRLRLGRLVEAGTELVQYGPLKPESEQGLSEEQLEALARKGEQGLEDATPREGTSKDGRRVLLRPDSTGRRCGEAPTSEYATTLTKTLDAAKAAIDKNLVALNHVVSRAALEEALSDVRGAVTIAYPQGLPEWEPVREILQGTEDLTGSAASKEVLDQATTTMWWAAKQLLPNKLLSDYVGKNEKTKIIAKLQKEGAGAPVREAPLSEQAQREMMAYYYRKQEEDKKLLEQDQDDYSASVWSDPKALKSAFNGVGSVSWRPT